MLELLGAYRNLTLQILLSLFLTLILSFFRISIIFLHGLCTYIQPENLNQNNAGNGLRPAIRRPSSTDDPKSNVEVRRRNRSKDKSEFDESNAQIFRIKLDEDHLRSRMYFTEYNSIFVLLFLAVSCFLLQNYFGVEDSHGVLGNGLMFPIVLGFIALCKVFVALGKISIERSASKKSEKRLSLIFGVLGFVFGIIISAGVFPKGFDFHLGSVDAFCCIVISFSMACIGGFLYMPAGRSARSFWVGTDQIRSNLSIISCGWFGRMILYANYIVSVFTSLLWIHPLAEILVKRSDNGGSSRSQTGLVGNVGMSSDDFVKFRVLCLLLSGLLQAIAVRPNLQMFLNEAVLSWYQRLHGSKTPDLEFSRAKMFLHNHYLCLVALQFLAPSVLMILFLGLSQIDLSSFAVSQLVCGSLPCSDFIKQVGLLMSWWVLFVWSGFASASLVFYRRGVLYVS
ncbi:Transmembrane protein 161A/B [Arabidopsis suecica]|uniref:Transmembrane protein 161A/B n=1 Tax=Arabidopsis suecica TaxID=45249 RepID=A0A8T1Y363_ARASU|nr:Transmembrane protein 161A/B [Arabidopsis suecica]